MTARSALTLCERVRRPLIVVCGLLALNYVFNVVNDDSGATNGGSM
jgi:hypothetical protein